MARDRSQYLHIREVGAHDDGVAFNKGEVVSQIHFREVSVKSCIGRHELVKLRPPCRMSQH